MSFKSLIICGFLIFINSCKKDNVDIETIQNNSAKEEKIDENINSKGTKIRLNKEAKEVVKNWTEYQEIAAFIPNYYKTNTSEALFNAQRLVALTQQLKDTIRVEKFKKPSFRIRLNVLHNEALRLADMDSIPSITNKEIIQESENIINAFEAIKVKINSVVNKAVLENDLKEFDYLFDIKTQDLDISKPKKNAKRKPIKKRKRRIKPLSNLKTE